MTGGNPFFVRELLSGSVDAVPETVRDAVLARLMQCSQAARAVAELVSLVPGRSEPWLARSILGDIGTAADEAVMCGLLKYHDETLAFRHELGRLAVESTIPRARICAASCSSGLARRRASRSGCSSRDCAASRRLARRIGARKAI